jgi:hypothetical protein
MYCTTRKFSKKVWITFLERNRISCTDHVNALFLLWKGHRYGPRSNRYCAGRIRLKNRTLTVLTIGSIVFSTDIKKHRKLYIRRKVKVTCYSESSTDFQRSMWHCVPKDSTFHTTIMGTSNRSLREHFFQNVEQNGACAVRPNTRHYTLPIPSERKHEKTDADSTHQHEV